MLDLLDLLKKSAVNGSASAKIISTNRLTSTFSGARGITVVLEGGKEEYEIATLEEFFDGLDKILAGGGTYKLQVYPDIALIIADEDAEYTLKCSMMEINDLVVKVDNNNSNSGGLVVVPPSNIMQNIANKVKIPLLVNITYNNICAVKKDVECFTPVLPDSSVYAVPVKKEELMVPVKPIKSKGYTNVIVSAEGAMDDETRHKSLIADVERHINNVETGNVNKGATVANLSEVRINTIDKPVPDDKEYRDKIFNEGIRALEELNRNSTTESTEDDFSC